MFRRAPLQALSIIALTWGPACALNSASASLPLDGQWGGEHALVTTSASGTHVELDCAHGDLSGRIKADAHGAFKMSGSFVRERGGPVRRDAPLTSVSATYEGSVLSDALTLTIRLADSSDPVGPFTLIRGAAGHVVKCRQAVG